jgi:hypothetical protein
MDSIVEIEKTMPISVWKANAMPWDEYAIYLVKLLSKSYHRYGEDGVWIYKASQTKGVVRFGRKFEDPDAVMVHVVLISHDGGISQDFLLIIPPDAKQKVKEILLPLLQSFRFQIDSFESEDQIKDLIRKAGT